jgi:Domain of Unknown Function (DUF1540).
MSKNIGKNRSIMCSVTSCQHHNDHEDFCALDRIQVGTHENDPAMNQCTDCQSFANVNSYEQMQAVQEAKMQQQQDGGANA